MQAADYARLLALAAMWGGSFIFMRSAAPEFGTIPTALVRASFGGLALVVYLAAAGLTVQWRRDWRRFVLIGLLNSALPFSLFAFAALYVPAAYSAIIYSSTSLFGAAFSALWLNDPMTTSRFTGMALGIFGVALVAGLGGAETDGETLLAAGACIGAAISYAAVAVYVSRHARDIDPRAVAGPSQVIAGLLLVPLLAVDPPGHVDGTIALNLAALALVSSGAAYLIFFRLLVNVGPSRALTVTFLVPVFAMLWGALFLSEEITLTMLTGTAAIVLGTLLVTGRLRVPGAAIHDPRRSDPPIESQFDLE